MDRRTLLVGLLGLSLLAGCQWEGGTSVKSQKKLVERDWPAGTVLVSRNPNEDDNTSPGYWNHLAIYCGRGTIVESQSDRGVITTPLKEYLQRGYTWVPLFPIDQRVGELAALKAQTLIGLPYRQISSMLLVDRREEAGLNCVSVVRVSYVEALGHNLPGLRTPDDALEMTNVFQRTWPQYQ